MTFAEIKTHFDALHGERSSYYGFVFRNGATIHVYSERKQLSITSLQNDKMFLLYDEENYVTKLVAKCSDIIALGHFATH